jgi:hypothetical protein
METDFIKSQQYIILLYHIILYYIILYYLAILLQKY